MAKMYTVESRCKNPDREIDRLRARNKRLRANIGLRDDWAIKLQAGAMLLVHTVNGVCYADDKELMVYRVVERVETAATRLSIETVTLVFRREKAAP